MAGLFAPRMPSWHFVTTTRIQGTQPHNKIDTKKKIQRKSVGNVIHLFLLIIHSFSFLTVQSDTDILLGGQIKAPWNVSPYRDNTRVALILRSL
jgi:hypothetical protein